MAEPTIGGRTAEQLMDEAVKKAYATAIATATLAGLPVSRGERAALKAGAAAGCMALIDLLVESRSLRMDGEP